MALLTDEIKAWIGREFHYPAREELGYASIRYFALAIGDDNPLYLEEAYAHEAGYPSVIAPPTLICETCQYAHRRPEASGYIGHEWHLPITNCRMIRAGNAYVFVRSVLPVDRISVTWTLEDIVERASPRGGTQLFVSSVARYKDATDEVVAINHETVVYQPIETA
ncbi:acyl dehydratase [Bradyrhizobium elkanii]|nr:acyl dehydratase [Bradyrhizobium elkanii]